MNTIIIIALAVIGAFIIACLGIAKGKDKE